MRLAGRVGTLVLLLVLPASAQRAPVDAAATRLAILAAEDRRAPTERDLAAIRAGARSRDPQTARMGVRALGRLERPELIPDLVPALRNPSPEIRSEAANALAQAAQGWVHEPPSKTPRVSLDLAAAALSARLTVDADTDVRAAIAEALGRLPYASAAQVDTAERALMAFLDRGQLADDRLGGALGLGAIARTRRRLSLPPGANAVASLRSLAELAAPSRIVAPPGSGGRGTASVRDPARDARVRRLALDALILADGVDDETVRRAFQDPDAQVRRLAMRAVATVRAISDIAAADVLRRGLADPVAMVRIEALASARRRQPPSPDLCAAAIDAARDPVAHVALAGLDALAACPTLSAVSLLEQAVHNASAAGLPRAWHPSAHAVVALAGAAPMQALAALPLVVGSPIWQVRMYAARAAAVLKDRGSLETLARDPDANVREAAIEGLTAVAGHAADAVYIDALQRGGYQAVRVAATALAGTSAPDAVAALRSALRVLIAEGRDNSLDARRALVATLRGRGATVEAAATATAPPVAPGISAAQLRRLASARARVSIRGVGRFDLALIGAEAPVTAARFMRLAESGYYDGLTIHRVAPNFVVQGGSPGANEYIGDATFMRDELGLWPHVRGAVGISTRGRDTGDAQIFIDLVDNPRLDHEFTVFAHVLNGMDIVDAILEGDVIEKVEIQK